MCAFQITPRIETQNLALRAPGSADADVLAENAAEFAEILGDGPALDAVDPLCGGQVFVIDAKDQGLVGMASLRKVKGEPFWRLGYQSAPGSRDAAYAVEAISALTQHAAERLRKKALTALVRDEADPVGEALIEAGFLPTNDRQTADGVQRYVWLA